MKNNTCMASDI